MFPVECASKSTARSEGCQDHNPWLQKPCAFKVLLTRRTCNVDARQFFYSASLFAIFMSALIFLLVDQKSVGLPLSSYGVHATDPGDKFQSVGNRSLGLRVRVMTKPFYVARKDERWHIRLGQAPSHIVGSSPTKFRRKSRT